MWGVMDLRRASDIAGSLPLILYFCFVWWEYISCYGEFRNMVYRILEETCFRKGKCVSCIVICARQVMANRSLAKQTT